MKKKQMLAALMGVAMLSTLLAGCGGGDKEGSSSSRFSKIRTNMLQHAEITFTACRSKFYSIGGENVTVVETRRKTNFILPKLL